MSMTKAIPGQTGAVGRPERDLAEALCLLSPYSCKHNKDGLCSSCKLMEVRAQFIADWRSQNWPETESEGNPKEGS